MLLATFDCGSSGLTSFLPPTSKRPSFNVKVALSSLFFPKKKQLSVQGVSKKRSFVIPAPQQALGCSKGLDISQQHGHSSFFGRMHYFKPICPF